jgi:citrate synthase
MALVDGVLSAAQRRAPTHPNVDFALAALGLVANMPDDAGEVIFAVARTAGWIAHAIEEYGEPPARFRPRANHRPRAATPVTGRSESNPTP